MKANAGEVYTVYNQYLKRYTACQVAYIAPPDTVSKESWAVVLSLDWVGDAPLTAEELPHLRPLYSAYDALTSGIQVKCPKCHGTGVVTADEDNAYFRCLSCGHQVARDRTIYRYDVHNQCKNCGRYYRVDIEDEERQHFSVLHVACPYCGTTMPGEVHKTAEAFSYIGEIRDGREPYFGLELWFLTSFQGKPVWALNREHLAYLIGYLSADLREKPPGRAKMTQADHLPTFMKTAKNRERIVKLLRQMQEK